MSSFAAAGDFDRIQRELNQFRLEQEANLLKIGTGHRDKKVLVSPAKLSHNRTIEDKSLEKYFDLDCVILLESSNAKGPCRGNFFWLLLFFQFFIGWSLLFRAYRKLQIVGIVAIGACCILCWQVRSYDRRMQWHYNFFLIFFHVDMLIWVMQSHLGACGDCKSMKVHTAHKIQSFCKRRW